MNIHSELLLKNLARSKGMELDSILSIYLSTVSTVYSHFADNLTHPKNQ